MLSPESIHRWTPMNHNRALPGIPESRFRRNGITRPATFDPKMGARGWRLLPLEGGGKNAMDLAGHRDLAVNAAGRLSPWHSRWGRLCRAREDTPTCRAKYDLARSVELAASAELVAREPSRGAASSPLKGEEPPAAPSRQPNADPVSRSTCVNTVAASGGRESGQHAAHPTPIPGRGRLAPRRRSSRRSPSRG
jgi:hypothetical protein